MLLYILKSTACLIVLLGFYKLFLEQENLHSLKRIYLIAAIFLAFGLPQLTLTKYVTRAPIAVSTAQTETSVAPIAAPMAQPLAFSSTTKEEPFNIMPVLWGIYLLGVLFFAIKFFKNCGGIIDRISRGQKIKTGNFTKVLHTDPLSPHTFLKYIFLNQAQVDKGQIPQEVIWHEEAHAKQNHSLDIVLVALLQIVFWFNPIWLWLKHLIKTNHEFLADQAVTQKTKNISAYQHILVDFTSKPTTPPLLANAINYATIKKRIIVMQKKTSKAKTAVLVTVLLPLLGLLTYGFSSTQVVTIAPAAQNELVSPQGDTFTEEVSTALMQEYRNLIKKTKGNNGQTSIQLKDKERAKVIYTLMSAAQKATVVKYPDLPMPKLGETKQRTAASIPADNIKIQHTDPISILINKNGQLLVNNELCSLKDLQKRLQTITKGLSQQQKAQLKIHLQTDKNSPIDTVTAVKRKLKTVGLLNHSLAAAYPQTKATKEELATYNALARKYNGMAKGKTIVKKQELDRLEQLYGRMSAQQRANNAPFPELAPPPAKKPEFPKEDNGAASDKTNHIGYTNIGNFGQLGNPNWAITKKNGKIGCIDRHGKVAVPFVYDDIGHFGQLGNPNWALAKKNGKLGCIDKQGKVAVPFVYDDIGHFGQLGNLNWALAKKNGKLGCIDRQGKVTVPFVYDDIGHFGQLGNLNWALAKKNGKLGCIDRQGKVAVPLVYDDLGHFGQLGNHNWTLAKKNGKLGCIDRQGKVAVPLVYDDLGHFGQLGNPNWTLAKKNGKLGCIDRQGKVAVPFNYDDIGFFGQNGNPNWAKVKMGNLLGFIDRQGKPIKTR